MTQALVSLNKEFAPLKLTQHLRVRAGSSIGTAQTRAMAQRCAAARLETSLDWQLSQLAESHVQLQRSFTPVQARAALALRQALRGAGVGKLLNLETTVRLEALLHPPKPEPPPAPVLESGPEPDQEPSPPPPVPAPEPELEPSPGPAVRA